MPDIPPARARRSWRLPVVALVVLALLAGGGVLGAQRLQASRDAQADREAGRTTAFPVFLPGEGEDGSDERLADVVADGQAFLAVGSATSGGRTTPVFLRSDDLGKTWTAAPLPDGTGPGDRPTQVTAGKAGRVAYGTGEEGDVAWTSADGRTWTRHVLDREVFGEQDEVNELRAGGEGFLAVGTETLPDGNGRGLLWASKDGISWTRRAERELGLAPQRRGSYFTDIAVRGTTVVIGAGEYDQGAQVKNNLAFYTSTDGGKAFRRAPTPLELAARSRAYVRALLVTPSGFVALGPGASEMEDTGYDTNVLTSTDGLRWERDAFDQPSSRSNDLLAAATLTPYGVMGVGASDDDAMLVGQLNDSYYISQDGDSPHLSRPGDQALDGVASIGQVLVAVGRDTSSGDGDALLVRRDGPVVTGEKTPSSVERIALPMLDEVATTSATAVSVAATDEGWVAAGTSGSQAAVWTSSDGRSWDAVRPRAGIGDGDGEQVFNDVAAPAGGGLVLAGSSELTIAPGALLVRMDGDRADNVSPLGLSMPNEYADRVLLSVAAGPKAVVAVGYGDDGGANGSAVVAVSPDGKRFSDGKPAKDAATPEGVDDLTGDVARSRSMTDVAARGDGFVAVGTAGVDEVTRPAAWTSTDGTSWALTPLALPAGATSAALENVVVRGDRLVATGSVTGDDGVGAPMAWTSADGRTWSAGVALPLPDGRRGDVREVVAVDGGLLAVGHTREVESGDVDAAAWVSTDGETWRPYALPGEAAPAPGRQSLSAGAVRGDDVLLVGSSVTTAAVEVLVVRLTAGQVTGAAAP